MLARAIAIDPTTTVAWGTLGSCPRRRSRTGLLKNDYGYIENGHIADLCTLAVVTTDNMRSESNHGRYLRGTRLFLRPRGGKAACGHRWFPLGHARNPEHLWILNWLGARKRPTLVHVLRGLYAGVEWSEDGLALADCVPEEPVGPPRYIRDEIAGQSAGMACARTLRLITSPIYEKTTSTSSRCGATSTR